jgi:multidrug efflux pump subunit AcrA (membrane-fusion protein)
MPSWVRHCGSLILIAGVAGLVLGQANDPPKKGDTKKDGAAKMGKMVGGSDKGDKSATKEAVASTKPSTHKASKSPFKIEVSLKGVFESEDMVEVVLRPDTWSGFNVLKAVEHGTTVKKGDSLVTLDMEKIYQAIHDAEHDLELMTMSLKQATEELPIVEKLNALELVASERTRKQADEDLKRYLDVDKDMAVKNAEFSVKNATNSLEYAKEELKQLEKMYRANDIREETEEIILKRQRNAVEMSQFFLNSSERRRDEVLKVTVPRQEESLRDSAVKQHLAYDRAKIGAPITLNQKRMALEKLKYDHVKATTRLQRLKKDHDMMLVKAPADGVVYYGRCVRGQWSGASMAATRLQHGGMLSADDVFMTIVKPRPIFVRASVDEKDLRLVRVGMAGKATPVMDPDLKLGVKVAEVSSIPLASGNFEARLALDTGKDDAGIVPGMSCSIKLASYAKADALTVPTSAVFSEDNDEDKRYVYRVGKDNQSQKQPVKTGKTSGGKTEILTGLLDGDEILTEKPAK